MEPTASPLDAKSRFKPKAVEIPPEKPFGNDCLNRQSEIENLTTLLTNSEPPLVLAIDAPWGSGKTTFMQMWRAHLSKEFPYCSSAYFSAWETDLSDDPLHVFLGEINEQLAVKTSGMTLFKWNKAIGLAGKITKRTLPALAKIATYGVLDLQGISKETERVLAELSGGIVSDGLETYKASVSAIKQFKENFTYVLEDIGKDHPVVIFVDELDRCRPQYAIAVLERIKHLLSLPGIIFVLGIDRSQLANGIRGAYGESFDSETYLQRFIDLDYKLAFFDSRDFIKKLIADYRLVDFFNTRHNSSRYWFDDESERLVDTCADVVMLFNLTLREIEQLLARVNIVARSTASSQPIYPHLLVGLLALRCKEADLYSRLTSGKGSSLELVHLVAQKREEMPLDSGRALGTMVACIILAISRGDNSDPGYAYVLEQSTVGTVLSDKRRELMASTADVCSHIASQRFMGIDLNSLVRRIEMSQSFLV
jgi:hypothetical protein